MAETVTFNRHGRTIRANYLRQPSHPRIIVGAWNFSHLPAGTDRLATRRIRTANLIMTHTVPESNRLVCSQVAVTSTISKRNDRD